MRAISNLFFTIIVILVIIVTVVWATPPPKCPDQNDEDVTLFPNPDDCTTYYSCNYGYSWLMHCPDGLIYNSTERVCARGDLSCRPPPPSTTSPPSTPTKDPTASPKLFEELRHHSSTPPRPTGSPRPPRPTGSPRPPHPTGSPKPPRPTPSPTSPRPTDEPSSSTHLLSIQEFLNDNLATVTCPSYIQAGEIVLLRNPNDCGSFYLCNGDIPVLMRCPENLVFDPVSKQCDWNKDHHTSSGPRPSTTPKPPKPSKTPKPPKPSKTPRPPRTTTPLPSSTGRPFFSDSQERN